MSSGRNFMDIQRIKRAVCRGMMICCMATTLCATLTVIVDTKPVVAAANVATTVRQDRRPDRERPVTTSQGSSSQTSTTQARPRLVRR